MIVAFELSFASVSNIKFQRTFFCLNNIIEFFFFDDQKSFHISLSRNSKEVAARFVWWRYQNFFFYELLIVLQSSEIFNCDRLFYRYLMNLSRSFDRFRTYFKFSHRTKVNENCARCRCTTWIKRTFICCYEWQCF
jgi:hypothetical protein